MWKYSLSSINFVLCIGIRGGVILKMSSRSLLAWLGLGSTRVESEELPWVELGLGIGGRE